MFFKNLSHRICFFSLTICLQLLPLAAADWASLVESAGPAVARISVTDQNGLVISQGTGFAVRDAGGTEVLVTNAHVVGEARYGSGFGVRAEFLFRDGDSSEVRDCRISRYDPALDLCVLLPEGPVPAVLELGAEELPPLMTEILVIGYPLGLNFKATPGYVQAFQQVEKRGSMLDMSAVLAPGNSGGPVINGSGEVLGIATATIPGYNFNLAIPVANLLTFLREDGGTRTVHFLSSPSDSWVFIDGSFKGKTPLEIRIPDRNHQVRLEKEGYQSRERTVGPWEGEGPVEEVFTLPEKEDANPSVSIITDPAGAEIYINNQLAGISPLEVRFSSGRILRIRTSLSGYREATESHRVTDDPSQEVSIVLHKKFLFW